MEKEIYQVKITLKGSKPAIWRRVLVPSDILLSKFHEIIQVVMGWEDYHLHHFIKDDIYYSAKLEDDFFWDDSMNQDYKKMRISALLKGVKDRIEYEYDFGDGWLHDIQLEKVLPGNESHTFAVCLAGANNCPPEDCGGIWGYYSMLEILKQPDHEDYENYKEWLGDDFDPAYFNLDEVNKKLRHKSFKFR